MVLDCRSDWSDCQKQQMQAKADALDSLAKQRGGLMSRKPPPLLRKVGQVFQRRFHALWASTSPTGRFPQALEPCRNPAFFPNCPACSPTPVDPAGAGMQADHVLELQLRGGNPAGPLRWLDASVNQSCGAQLMNQRKIHGEFKVVGIVTRGC